MSKAKAKKTGQRPPMPLYLVVDKAGHDCVCVTNPSLLRAYTKFPTDRFFKVLLVKEIEDPRL